MPSFVTPYANSVPMADENNFLGRRERQREREREREIERPKKR